MGDSPSICFRGTGNIRFSHLPGTYRGAQVLNSTCMANTLPTELISSPDFCGSGGGMVCVCVLLLLLLLVCFIFTSNKNILIMINW